MDLKFFKNSKYSDGFTLAEVLITLVIIGIIAAMTVPTIIQNSNESATVSKVKKGLSVLGQAKMLAEAQNGPVADWDFGEGYSAVKNLQFWKYLRPYIQVAQDCGSSTGCYQTNATYYLNGTDTTFNHGNLGSLYKFVLSDGGVMWFRLGMTGKCTANEIGVPNECAIFYHDVNGDKEPNAYGRDIFLYVFSTDGVFPVPRDDCYKNNQGLGCSAYIIKNSNMKYLH